MRVLTTEDLENVLKISRRRARILMQTEGFPSIKIGAQYRVTESALYQWLDNTDKIKLDYNKC